MIYIICFVIAVAAFFAGIIAAVQTKNRRHPGGLRPAYYIMGGVFVSATSLFLPIYAENFQGDEAGGLKTLLIAIHNAIRLFIVDGEFNIIDENITGTLGNIWIPYSILAAILFVFAPILTFGAILSLVRNVYSYVAYIMVWFRDVYVFSELNDEANALARSIRENHPWCAIVYTDVFEDNDEASYERMQRARMMQAIFFKNDIEFIRFGAHSRRKRIIFLTIGHDEQENIRQSVNLIDKYKDRDNTELYVFSTGKEGELLLSDLDKGRIKVRRINERSAMITRYLYERGEVLFDEAATGQDGIRRINVVIAGLGQYGGEMLRTLAWFCQMDGYRITIDAYDLKRDVLDRFRAFCPELISPEHNGFFEPQEAGYLIRIHPMTDIGTASFLESVPKGEDGATFVFVALGSDEANMRAATELRVMYERMGLHPRIVTVVQSSHVNRALAGIRNFSGQPYDIEFIGGMDDVYSEKAIMDSELEKDALERHLRYGNDKKEEEEKFWKYEYNYRSSVATALHARVRIHCGMTGADKKKEDLTEQEERTMEMLEHRRWNAYMRSEGYVFSGSTDPASRNNLARMHHDLVPYDVLTGEEQDKDSRVAAKG